MKERLELVKSWDELRTGMLVVTKPCRWCGAKHWMLLVRLNEPSPGYGADGSLMVSPHWTGEGDTCTARPGYLYLPRGIAPESVASGVIYRVVDGLEDSKSATDERVTAKPAKKRLVQP